MNVRLIEPGKVSAVSVTYLDIGDGVSQRRYQVNIENYPPYVVAYVEEFLSQTAIHENHLSPEENKVYCAIRARNKPKRKEQHWPYEGLLIGSGNWDEFKLRKVGADLKRDEAKATLARLLYRAASDPYSNEWTFQLWDLKASLDFENFENDLLFFQKQGFIEQIRDQVWTVTKEGFRYFEERVRQENMPLLLNVNRYFQRVPLRTKKPFAFVVMPFREEECPQAYFENHIKPTVKEISGYECVRADEDHEPGKIDNKVWTLIQDAEFIIAEITTPNPNVILELGIALTFGKPVYPFTRRPQQETLSIDNKTLLAEQYTDEEDLKAKLIKVLPKK